eukprot:COSAG06_NODE_17326_length_948_cov_0.872792_2_plen_64_part_01
MVVADPRARGTSRNSIITELDPWMHWAVAHGLPVCSRVDTCPPQPRPVPVREADSPADSFEAAR